MLKLLGYIVLFFVASIVFEMALEALGWYLDKVEKENDRRKK